MKIFKFKLISTIFVLGLFIISSCSPASSSSSSLVQSSLSSSASLVNSTNQVVVNQTNIIAIEVEKLPNKLVYTSNEVISTQGGQLRVVYSDYRVKFVSITDDMIDTSRLDTSKVGTTSITLKYQVGDQVLFTRYQVSIVPFKVTLTNVEIDIKQTDVLFEQTVDLKYIVTPSNAIYEQVVWSSSNPLVAIVDENGVVTPVNQGEVVITVTVDGKLSASSKLNILPMQPKEIELNQTYVSLISQGWIPLSTATDLETIDNNLTATSYTFAQFTPYATTISNLNATAMLDKNYFLINDIDLSSIANWTPLGTFTGVLDGRGYAIRNLVINRTSSNLGLFSYIYNAEVKNLTLLNPKVTLTVPDTTVYTSIGTLAGNLIDSTLTNINVSKENGIDSFVKVINTGSASIYNSEATTSAYFGGLVGAISDGNATTSVIDQTKVSIDVQGTRWVGGIVGAVITNTSLNIVNSGFTGTIKPINVTVGYSHGHHSQGGLIGRTETTGIINITNSFVESNINLHDNSGSMSNRTEWIGGFIGNASSLGTVNISKSYFKGSLKAHSKVGKVVGRLVSTNINVSNSYFIGTVDSTDFTGSLFGEMTTGQLSKTVNLTNVIFRGSNNQILANSGSRGIISGSNSGTQGFTLTGDSNNKVYYSSQDLYSATTIIGGLATTYNFVESKTNALLQQQATFIGYDYDTIWRINPSINNGYPYLTWEE